jgi:hypothetical protein
LLRLNDLGKSGEDGKNNAYLRFIKPPLVIASSSDERADVANFTEAQRCVKHHAELQTGRINVTR